MADNTTTYKAVIETEVKGQKEVDDYNKSLDEGGEKFVSLRRQIRETTVALQEMADKGQQGSKEFKNLSNQLDELQDQQKRVAFQSAQIEDKLAALPGPIGQIGKGFASAKEAVDTFGKGLAVATGGITLIIGAVLAMKEAMGKTKEGQETLNKVTEAFGKIMAPIFALFEKVGIPIFNKVAEVLGWLGDKLSSLLQKLGVTPAKINEIATEGNKAFYDAAQKDLENAKKVADLQKEQDEKNKAEALKRRQKYIEQQEELQRLADDKEKRDLQYQLDQMEKMRKKFADKLGIIESDTIATRTKLGLKEEADRIKREKDFEDQIRVLKINSIEKQTAWAAKNTSTALTKEIEAKTTAAKKEDKVLTWLNSEKKKKLDENLAASKAALNIAANLVDEGSAAAKAIAVAQTGIDTYQSATAAYKATVGIPVVGPFLAPIAAAAAIAAGLISVNKIINTPVPKMGDGGAGDASAGAGVSITAPSIPPMQFSEGAIGVGGGQNPTSQIADTLAQTTKKPIQAYVVSTQMSSQQALDRRTNQAATF
jgi:hypothetical protein